MSVSRNDNEDPPPEGPWNKPKPPTMAEIEQANPSGGFPLMGTILAMVLVLTWGYFMGAFWISVGSIPLSMGLVYFGWPLLKKLWRRFRR